MKNTKNISEKYYTELDQILLYNWRKCIEGKFHFMLVEPPKGKRKTKDLIADKIAFENLYNKYIEEYGLGEKAEEHIETKKRIIEYRLDYIQSGDRSLLTDIEIEERILKDNDPTNYKGMTIGEVLVYINKWMGGEWKSDRQLTVAEFQDLIKQYEQSNQKG